MSAHVVGHEESLVNRLRDEIAWLRRIVETLISSTVVDKIIPEPAEPADAAPDRRARRAHRIDPPHDTGRAVSQTRPGPNWRPEETA